MIPTGELTEPFVIRPTSETVIGAAFARWTSSYRDLPLKVNQWCNVMRWEMRPRIFLRTAEFLWQEGHTAHETREEAIEETLTMHKVYEEFQRDVLAIPTIPGEKTEAERFPGAEQTYTVEAMVQDRKAIQAGTSHFLGQNFSKSQNICFAGRDNTQQFAWTSSWGVSTRMIGALIMMHSDDDGLVCPPRVAPQQIVIIPVTPKEESRQAVLDHCEELARTLRAKTFHGQPLRVLEDRRDLGGGAKKWEWVKKGVPVRLEIGPGTWKKAPSAFSGATGPPMKNPSSRKRNCSIPLRIFSKASRTPCFSGPLPSGTPISAPPPLCGNWKKTSPEREMQTGSRCRGTGLQKKKKNWLNGCAFPSAASRSASWAAASRHPASSPDA